MYSLRPGTKASQLLRKEAGTGYEALHPELEGVNPEDYPDIHKMAILADVAPYSAEYHTYRSRVGKEAQGNTELEIEYEKILTRVKKTRESVIRMTDRHFTEPVDEISGTVDEVSPGGVTLNEYPGRLFEFSSVSTSAADMSARILGEQNNMTRSEVAAEVDRRRGALQEYQVFPSCLAQNSSRAHAENRRFPRVENSLIPPQITDQFHWPKNEANQREHAFSLRSISTFDFKVRLVFTFIRQYRPPR